MKDRILQLMKEKGMSQKQFAGELCIGEATLSSIFTGRTRPTINITNSIHECFPEVSIPWLMFGEGEMYNTSSSNEAHKSDEAVRVQSDDVVPNLFSMGMMEDKHPSTPQNSVREVVKYIDKPKRKITEIRVFFDDGTYETFTP